MLFHDFSDVFELKSRDWLAKHGIWKHEELEAEVPNILFLESGHFPRFDKAEVFIPTDRLAGARGAIRLPLSCADLLEEAGDENSYVNIIQDSGDDIVQSLDSSKPHLHIIAHALELANNPRRFVRFVAGLASTMHPESVVYTPGLGKTQHIALLAYLGVGLMDSAPLAMSAAKGTRLSVDGEIKQRYRCHCPGCEGKGEIDTAAAYVHNCYTALAELRKVRHAIEDGQLREMTESRVRAEPWLVSCLRIADKEHFNEWKPFLPVAGSGFAAISGDSMHRPDIEYYHERLALYRKPKGARVLVLLPCSARKPYSNSKSHRRIIEAVERSGCRSAMHEVIVTSPLGIVPRELELFYPAQHYDIPVTGHWNGDERKMLERLLGGLLSENKYEHMIIHLPEDYGFVGEMVDGTRTASGSATSEKSLAMLQSTIKELCSCSSPPKWKDRLLQDMENRIAFQLCGAVPDFLKGTTVRGKYPFLKVFNEDGKQLCMLNPERGMVSIANEGGRRMMDADAYWVEIDDFKLAGTVFAMGVNDADERIRAGDEIVLKCKDEMKGMGKALMCARDMNQCEKGAAVKVRSKVR
jgi:archaeosine synthase